MNYPLGFVSLLALSVATPALAQTESALSQPHDKGDTIVVTASRSGDGIPARLLGSSVTVLDSSALEQRQTRIVSDILRDVPGIAVSRTGPIGGLTQIRIRGTEGNHSLVLIDGIKASDPYQGEFDFATLIADPYAKIEVLRGQQSSLYGSDAIGGVVQYITLTGAEAPGVALSAEGGSFGTYTASARIAGVADTLDYAISGGYYHSKGTPSSRYGTRDIGADVASASAKLIWTPSDTFKVTGVARYSYTDADVNNSDNDPNSPLFGYTVDSPGSYFTNHAFYGLVRAELSALDDRWITAVSGQIVQSKRKTYEAKALSFGTKGNRYKGSLESSLRLGNDVVKHQLTAALDVEREEFQTLTPGASVFRGKRHTDNIGFVGQYELLVNDAFSFGASVRHDDNNRFANSTTWRTQASYSLSTGTRLRAAYGTGVKSPSYLELYGYNDGRYIGNPNLKPEKSKGWEVGLEQSFAGNRNVLSVTYFDSRLTDEIYTTYPAPNHIATPANRTTKSKQHGLEFVISARPIDQLRLEANYTWLHAREDGVVEVRRPKHIASFNTTVFSRDERFSSTLTIRYNGRQRDNAYTDPSWAPVPVTLQEYVLINLNADYKLNDNVTLFGRIENLANERYEEVFSLAAAGRGAFGGVRVRF